MDKDPNVRKFAQSQEVILNAAKNDDKFPFEVLIEMSKSNMDIYKKVMLIAKDPNIKEEHLKLIIKSNSSVSMVAMMNPNCPVDILINQSNSKNKTMKDFAIKVLKIRASNPATSIDDLIYLSKIKEYQLFVANNPSCPDFILMSLKNKPVSLFFSKSTKKRIKDINNNIEQEDYSLRRK
jgi:hypothetical protein